MTEKEEIKLLKEHAHLIWGGIPIDIQWALNTQIWKQYVKSSIRDIRS